MIKGIINRVSYSRGRFFCTITDGKKEYVFYNDTSIPHGAAVFIEGEVDGNKINPKCVVALSDDQAKEVMQEVERNIKESIVFPEGPSLVKDEIMHDMWPDIKKAATELIHAKKLGKEVILRFHGDADGIAGAFALSNIIRCKTYQQNSAIYSARDALRDIGSGGQEANILVILLDFGSNDQSFEAQGLLKAAKIKCLVIDHHPLGEKRPDELVSPFKLSDDGSKYTAGYLACEIAIACGMDKEYAKMLAGTACAGDKSRILEVGKEEKTRALVFDYLAAHTSFGNNLSFYKQVSKNEELFRSIALQAEEAIAEAANKAKAKMKKDDADGIEIITFALDGVVKKDVWPPAGKVTTYIFESLSKDAPLICIGHRRRSLIIRINNAGVERGLSANELAKKIKESMADFVDGGGGHARAGAIRAREGFTKEVLSELIRLIKDASSN